MCVLCNTTAHNHIEIEGIVIYVDWTLRKIPMIYYKKDYVQCAIIFVYTYFTYYIKRVFLFGAKRHLLNE